MSYITREKINKKMVSNIKASVEINARLDQVWRIVSDVDRDVEYWNGLNSIKNVRREENVVERIVSVGFMGKESYQTIKLSPKQSIELVMSKGPLKGSRLMELNYLKESGRTRLSVVWNFEFSGVPIFARPFVKSQLERTTTEALEKIALVAERRRGEVVTSSH